MAAEVPLTPFEVSFDQSQIEALRSRLKQTRWPSSRSHETSLTDFKYGPSSEWMQSLTKFWSEEFFEDGCKDGWKYQLERINGFHQFKTRIEDWDIHFVHEKAAGDTAGKRTVPILLLHGWPGCFLEFLDCVKGLTKGDGSDESLVFDVIIPSHPGYLFSNITLPPSQPSPDLLREDVARIMDRLMVSLGYQEYVIQAGDWGGFVARIIACRYPERCKAVHLNYCPAPAPEPPSDVTLSEKDKKRLERAEAFKNNSSAYAALHGTRPATLAFSMSDSPVGLLAWIGEKFASWTDEKPSRSTILTFVTLYYLTDTMSTCLYPYRNRPAVGGPSWIVSNPELRIKVPTGFSDYPLEIAPSPKSWIAGTCNLKWYKEHDRGGHFAALERPGDMVSDIRDCFAAILE